MIPNNIPSVHDDEAKRLFADIRNNTVIPFDDHDNALVKTFDDMLLYEQQRNILT